MLYSTISSLLSAAIGVAGIQLPSLTGQYPVGTVSLELIDDSRIDPFAPSPQPRDLMVSIFYPTSKTAIKAGNYSFPPYFPSKIVSAFDSYLGSSEEIAEIVTQAYYGAPIKSNDFPVLIFSPGLGGSRLIYAAQLEDLASQGWIIVAVDHTYDALVVEFPDGEVIPWLPSDLDDFPNKMPSLVEVRVADVEFVASALKNSTTLSQIPGLNSSCGGIGPLHSNRIGIFGHSLGGATAAQALSNSTTFACGANYDGSIYGPVVETGFHKPFLQIEAQGHNRTNDATWAEFLDHLSGSHWEFTVNNTVHIAFADFPVLRDLLGEVIPAQQRGQFGTIAGGRLLEIETAFMDAFFAFCLKGKPAEYLENLAQGRFPEVSVP